MNIKMTTTPTKAIWQAEQDVDLLRALVQLILSNRSVLYATPSLADFNHHGGDKINKRIKTMLGKFVAAQPGAEGMIKEEIAKLKVGRGGGKRKSADDGGSPAKSTPKKRKTSTKVKSKEMVEDELDSEIDE